MSYPSDLALFYLAGCCAVLTTSGWLYAFEYNVAGEQTGYYFFTRYILS